MSTPVEVTALWCPDSGGEPGEDNTTHHLQPRTRSGARVLVCAHCGRTEEDLRNEERIQRNLRRTSTASLIGTAYALTRRASLAVEQAPEYLAQRDRITVEVQRRLAALEEALQDVVGDHCDSHAERLRTCPTCSALTALDALRDADRTAADLLRDLEA